MSKMNRALFDLLRKKVVSKYQAVMPDCSIFKKAVEEEFEKAVKKASKEQLVTAILKGKTDVDDFGVKTYYQRRNEWVAPQSEERDALLKEIDNAEMLFPAGDNEAAKALIEKINNL